MKYTLTPQVVDAVQWQRGMDEPRVRPPINSAYVECWYGVVDTPAGTVPVDPGDWLVVDAAGTLTVWTNEYFQRVFVLAPGEEIFA